MKKLIVYCLLGLFLVPVVGGGSSLALAQGGGGKAIFDDHCAMCHGTDGKGNGPAASSFSPSPKDFNTSTFWQTMNRAKIKETMENGHGPMPPIELSNSQMNAVIKYMEQAFKK